MALGDGRHKLPVPSDVRRAIAKGPGDTVTVRPDERLSLTRVSRRAGPAEAGDACPRRKDRGTAPACGARAVPYGPRPTTAALAGCSARDSRWRRSVPSVRLPRGGGRPLILRGSTMPCRNGWGLDHLK